MKQERNIKKTMRAKLLNSSGVAAIEFAIILPVLTLVTFGGYEGWRMVLAAQRVDRVATAVADSASRLSGTASENDIANIMDSGDFIARPFDMEGGGRIILSLVSPDGARPIIWQRCYGAKNVNSRMGAQSNNAVLANIRNAPANQDNYMLVAEVTMDYRPNLIGFLYPNLTFSRSAVIPTRNLPPTQITNTGGASALCSAGATAPPPAAGNTPPATPAIVVNTPPANGGGAAAPAPTGPVLTPAIVPPSRRGGGARGNG